MHAPWPVPSEEVLHDLEVLTSRPHGAVDVERLHDVLGPWLEDQLGPRVRKEAILAELVDDVVRAVAAVPLHFATASDVIARACTIARARAIALRPTVVSSEAAPPEPEEFVPEVTSQDEMAFDLTTVEAFAVAPWC